MSYYDNAQDKASLLADKLQGLTYLFLNAKLEGSREKDTEAHYGIGLILEGLAQEARDVDHMLDSATRPKLATAK